MKHFKDEGRQYIQKFPKLKKWINECAMCHRQGYKPDMPDKITKIEGSFEVYYIKKYFDVLALNDKGLCDTCARLIDNKD